MADTQLNTILGCNLRKYREMHNQTRQIFAAAYGGSEFTLQGYEAGKKCPSLKRFLTLCNTFALSPNALLEGLYPWRTEIEDIRALMNLERELQGHRVQKLVHFQNIYLHDTIETRPCLKDAPLGTRLHILRLENDISIGSLAENCSVSKSTMQGYESGQFDPPLRVVLCLCETFGVSPEYLLSPCLLRHDYSDSRIAYLRPRQIKTLLALSRFFKNNL